MLHQRVDDTDLESASGACCELAGGIGSITIRYPAESTYQIGNAEIQSAFVLVSAPATRCITTAETIEVDASRTADGFVGWADSVGSRFSDHRTA